MTPRLPVGVIGVGVLGWHHARHLAAMPNVELAGVYDIRPERAEYVAKALGTRACRSREELLQRTRAVTVAVPTANHGEVGLAVLQAGRPLLMEKPLAATLDEADALIDAAARERVILHVGHIERFNRALRGAEPFLDRPLFIEGERLAPFQPRGTDVPVVLDLMIHDLDLILHLAGGALLHAVDVRANGAAVLSEHLDVAHARVEFNTGLVASVTASRIAEAQVRRLRVYQEEGYLSLDLAQGRGEFLRLRNGWARGDEARLEEVTERIPLQAPAADALRLELESFVETIRGDGKAFVSGAEGRAALALALQVTAAVHHATPIPHPEL
ncbi:MAG: Gfo/Idh/MocA family oxidoreductase [Gemmatimonadales bacterium]